MAFQLSPGINVSEIDLTTVVPAVATTEGASVVHILHTLPRGRVLRTRAPEWTVPRVQPPDWQVTLAAVACS